MIVSMFAFNLFTEIEFSCNALLASPLDFKNPDIEDNTSVIEAPDSISEIAIDF